MADIRGNNRPYGPQWIEHVILTILRQKLVHQMKNIPRICLKICKRAKVTLQVYCLINDWKWLKLALIFLVANYSLIFNRLSPSLGGSWRMCRMIEMKVFTTVTKFNCSWENKQLDFGNKSSYTCIS